MKKTKYEIHNLQCKQGFTVQVTTSNREHGGKKKTVAKASYFYSVLIVAKRVPLK